MSNQIAASLRADFGSKIALVNYTVVPSPTKHMCALPHSFVQPYNSVLHLANQLEFSDLTVMLDNESIYNVLNRSDIDLKNYDA